MDGQCETCPPPSDRHKGRKADPSTCGIAYEGSCDSGHSTARFTEVESVRKADRLELAKALQSAKVTGANTSSEPAILEGTRTFTDSKTFSGTLTASGTIGLGGPGQHRHGHDDRYLRDGNRCHDYRRHQDSEPRHRRCVRIDHGRQHRLGHSRGRGYDGCEYPNRHLRQWRHAGREAPCEPDRPVARQSHSPSERSSRPARSPGASNTALDPD